MTKDELITALARAPGDVQVLVETGHYAELLDVERVSHFPDDGPYAPSFVILITRSDLNKEIKS